MLRPPRLPWEVHPKCTCAAPTIAVSPVGGGARLSRVCVWGARDWARTDLHELGLFRGRGLRALHRHSEVRCVSREVEHVLDDRFVRNELLLRVTAFQTESQGASVDSSTVGGFDASCGE